MPNKPPWRLSAPAPLLNDGAMTMEFTLFLTDDELQTLTGFKAYARQIAWLNSKGWRFEINGNRKPIVARKYAEKMLGCGVPEERGYFPNFSAMQGA